MMIGEAMADLIDAPHASRRHTLDSLLSHYGSRQQSACRKAAPCATSQATRRPYIFSICARPTNLKLNHPSKRHCRGLDPNCPPTASLRHRRLRPLRRREHGEGFVKKRNSRQQFRCVVIVRSVIVRVVLCHPRPCLSWNSHCSGWSTTTSLVAGTTCEDLYRDADGSFSDSPGSIYPARARLERAKLIRGRVESFFGGQATQGVPSESVGTNRALAAARATDHAKRSVGRDAGTCACGLPSWKACSVARSASDSCSRSPRNWPPTFRSWAPPRGGADDEFALGESVP